MRWCSNGSRPDQPSAHRSFGQRVGVVTHVPALWCRGAPVTAGVALAGRCHGCGACRRVRERFAPRCARRPHGGATGWRCARKPAGSPTMLRTAKKCAQSASRWRSSRRQPSSRRVVRGEVFRLPASSRARRREQRGARYAVVVQADELLGLSTGRADLRQRTGGDVSARDRSAWNADPHPRRADDRGGSPAAGRLGWTPRRRRDASRRRSASSHPRAVEREQGPQTTTCCGTPVSSAGATAFASL